MSFALRSCRRCGCTDTNACEGGCYWVDADLCSACAGAAPALTAEVIATVHHHVDGPRLSYVVEGGLADIPEGTALYIIHPLEAPADGAIELFTSPAEQREATPEMCLAGMKAWDEAQKTASSTGKKNSWVAMMGIVFAAMSAAAKETTRG